MLLLRTVLLYARTHAIHRCLGRAADWTTRGTAAAQDRISRSLAFAFAFAVSDCDCNTPLRLLHQVGSYENIYSIISINNQKILKIKNRPICRRGGRASVRRPTRPQPLPVGSLLACCAPPVVPRPQEQLQCRRAVPSHSHPCLPL